MRFVLLSGKQGSGKTTTSSALLTGLRAAGYGAIQHRFSHGVYLAHDAVYAVLRPLGVLPEKKKDGLLLTLLGTEWGRALDPELWIKHARRFADQMDGKFANTLVKPLLVLDDLRFVNEFESFPEALRVRLECPEEVRKARMPEGTWRDPGHVSEVELDQYAKDGKFDVVYHADKKPTDEIVWDIVARAKEKLK